MNNFDRTTKTQGPWSMQEALERYKLTLIQRMERSPSGISEARRKWIMDLPTNTKRTGAQP